MQSTNKTEKEQLNFNKVEFKTEEIYDELCDVFDEFLEEKYEGQDIIVSRLSLSQIEKYNTKYLHKNLSIKLGDRHATYKDEKGAKQPIRLPKHILELLKDI
eukprot:Awhi_evm5s12155